ncbi:MAG: hypothetical protein HY819_16105 [Acidobacteria bacterium]|nr:hypothetical protein [Acidobacteriota bacterium]
MSNMVEYGREMKPTFGHIIRIWWAYSWRAFLFALVGGLAIGFGLSIILPPIFAQILGIFAGIVVAFISQLVAFRAIIGTNLNGFRLAVLQDTPKTEKARLNSNAEPTDKMIKAMRELSELSKK